MKTDVWLSKAVSKYGQVSLVGIHRHSAYAFATDTHRAHFAHSLHSEACEICGASQSDMLEPTLKQVSEYTTHFRVSTMHLVALCKQADAFRVGERFSKIRLDINGYLKLSTKHAGIGEWQSELHNGDTWERIVRNKRQLSTVLYEKVGPDMFAGINSHYLLQALAGMPDVVTISAKDAHSPISIVGDDRQAIIMPIYLDK